MSLHSPASAPWHGSAWQSSYTLSKGPNLPRLRVNVLHLGYFITFDRIHLGNFHNVTKVRAFNLPSLLLPSEIALNHSLRARICSVVRSEDSGLLECEIDPVIPYEELPRGLQTISQRAPMAGGAEQRFLLDFEWDKPVLTIKELGPIRNGIVSY